MIIVFLICLLIFIVCGLHNPLSVSMETVSSDKIDAPVRVALIADLHSCKYGAGQAELIQAVDSSAPDLICLVGDIFDDRLHNDNAEVFLSEISQKYPCYYVTGNHEHRMESSEFWEKMNFLRQCGITRLNNESCQIEINGQNLFIAGVLDPQSKTYTDMSVLLDGIKPEMPDKVFSLLLSHHPEYFSTYAESKFDLALCGHAHGGQWRIPVVLKNGLIAPGQGVLPKYTTGAYCTENFKMIVSRGLAKESTVIPRFFNRPEIVIIEIQ